MNVGRARIVICNLLAVVVSIAMSGIAHADPGVTEIEAQLDAAWHVAEPMIEQYNAVHEQYLNNKARQEEMLAAIAPLAEALDDARDKVGVMAARAYMGGQTDGVNALLGGTPPSDLADKLVYLDGFARTQTSQLRDVLNAKANYEAAKSPIDALVSQLTAQDADLAARRAEIEKRLDELQALRVQAYGTAGITGGYRPWTCPSEYLPTPGYAAASFACAEAGKRYVWGTSGPNTYDCSGLTLRAWQKTGVFLPHNAAMQRRSMQYVNRADLQIGDLVFYYSDLSHVAIYVGDGKVVHAPRAGDVVRMVPMDRGATIHSFGRP
jgi:hypothetical protein